MPLKQNSRFYYGWIIVAGAAVIICLLLGIRNAFGVFFPSIQTEFDIARAATSSIFSLYLIITSVASMVNGIMLDRFGPRIVFSYMGILTGLGLILTSRTTEFWQLYLSYSVMLAFGIGGTVPLIASTVSRWFDTNRGLAIAIATSGAGVGSLLISPLAGYMIEAIKWRASYLVLGILCVIVVIGVASFMKKTPEKHSSGIRVQDKIGRVRKDEKKQVPAAGLTLKQAVHTGNFWLVAGYSFLYAFATFMFITHTVPHAVDSGIQTVQASTIISILGGVSIASRLTAGRLADKVGTKKPAIAFALAGAVSFLLLLCSQQLWVLYLSAVGYGICWGGFGVTMLALISRIFGNRHLGAIMGTSDIAYAIGSAIGSILGGYIFDVRGSYTIAFIIAALCLVTTIPLVIAVRDKEHV